MCQAKRTTRSLRRLLLLLGPLGTILAILAGTGCIFSARDPEPPLDVNVDWLTPFQPENVLANMEAGIEAGYLTNYEDSLSEDYLFTPSGPDEAQAEAGWYEGYGRDRELEGMQRLFTRVDAIELSWNYDEEDLEEVGDEATFTLDNYELTVSYSGAAEQVYSGYAVITLAREGSDWKVVSWDEAESGALGSTWGTLRYELRN